MKVLVVEDQEPDFRLADIAIRRAFVDVDVAWALTLEEALGLVESAYRANIFRPGHHRELGRLRWTHRG